MNYLLCAQRSGDYERAKKGGCAQSGGFGCWEEKDPGDPWKEGATGCVTHWPKAASRVERKQNEKKPGSNSGNVGEKKNPRRGHKKKAPKKKKKKSLFRRVSGL